MPPSSTNKDLPGLWPASSRKWKETSRFLENGDLPSLKKRKFQASVSRMPARKEMSTHSSPSTQKSSVGIGGVDEDEDNSISPYLCKVIPEQDLVPVEGSDKGDDEGRTTAEDLEEEDEEAEMSEPVAVLNHYC